MSRESLQEILCCIGQPVAGNPTQFMMERAFAAAGLDLRYLTLEVAPENLGDAIRGMKALGFRGGNVTLPHKVAVTRYLDELSEAAELIGAVNCIDCVDGRYVGENTDGKGFLESLREATDPAGKKVTLLGAGGAARAIAVELGLAGAAEITVVNRSEKRGEKLVRLLGDRVRVQTKLVAWEGDYRVEKDTDVLINATSIGLNDSVARVPVATDSLAAEMVVADVIFNPPKTRLLRDAAERGCKTLDGLGMLVGQGAIGLKIWSGVEPDKSVMCEAVEEFLLL